MAHIYKMAEGYTHWLSYQGLPLTKVVTGETKAYMMKDGKEGDGGPFLLPTWLNS